MGCNEVHRGRRLRQLASLRRYSCSLPVQTRGIIHRRIATVTYARSPSTAVRCATHSPGRTSHRGQRSRRMPHATRCDFTCDKDPLYLLYILIMVSLQLQGLYLGTNVLYRGTRHVLPKHQLAPKKRLSTFPSMRWCPETIPRSPYKIRPMRHVASEQHYNSSNSGRIGQSHGQTPPYPYEMHARYCGRGVFSRHNFTRVASCQPARPYGGRCC